MADHHDDLFRYYARSKDVVLISAISLIEAPRSRISDAALPDWFMMNFDRIPQMLHGCGTNKPT